MSRSLLSKSSIIALHNCFFRTSQPDYEFKALCQDETSTELYTESSQLCTEEACKVERTADEADSKLRLLHDKLLLTPKQSGMRYTIAEDLQILNYTSIHPLSSAGSRKYWQQAIKDPAFPCKYRTVESLRDRYRYQLRFVEEEDKKRMEEWVKVHGDKGYSIFNTVPKKGPGGKKVFHRKLVILELEDTIYSKASTHNVIETQSTNRRDKNMKENRSSTGKVPEIFIFEPQVSISREPHRREEEITLDPSLPKSQGLEITHEISSVQTADTEFDDLLKMPSGSKKRKEYHHMNDTDEFIMPYKAIKPNPTVDFLDIECEWFEEDKSQEQYLNKDNYHVDQEVDLFSSFSMGFEPVNKYFPLIRSISWSEEEDRLLTSPDKEIYIKILAETKGIANVKERVEFLETFNMLFS